MAAICEAMHDLTIILVSHNGERWLRPCLESLFAHGGECEARLVVVNNADDGTAEVVRNFPHVRIIRCENRGFAHANNRALLTSTARYALFLNVDTEILDGTFAELVEALDERPTVGLAGVRQLSPEATLLRRSGGSRARSVRSGRLSDPSTFRFVRNGSANESSTSGCTSESARATGHQDRSSSRAAKRFRAPASSTSVSSSTAKSRISASGSSRRDGTSAISLS